jgi:hypothetical protein
MKSVRFAYVCACACLAACAGEPPVRDPAEGLRYSGFVAGTWAFDVVGAAGVQEEWSIANSQDFVGIDAVGVDVSVRRGGFDVDDRTFTLASSLTALSFSRFGSCVARCRVPENPLVVASWPFLPEESSQTTLAVESRASGAESTSSEETHTFVVGAKESIAVRKGAYDVYPVAWTEVRAVDGSNVTNATQWWIAPEVGVVAFTTPNGERLERAP